MDGLFDLDAVVNAEPHDGGLPAPDKRSRLRMESQLSPHQIADACDVGEETLLTWEEGTATPHGDSAAIYSHLLEALDARLNGTAAPQPSPRLMPDWAALGSLRHEIPTVAPDQAACRRCKQPTTQRVGGNPQHLGTRCPAPDTTPQPATTAPAFTPTRHPAPGPPPFVPAPRPPHSTPATQHLHYPALAARRYSDGPLAVLDAADHSLQAYLADGRTRSCPARSLPALLAWALSTPLGAAPVRTEGLPSGPLLVLTSTALAHLGLPTTAPAPPQRHPRSDHPLLQQIRAIGWQSDDDGLGPWTRLHPSNGDPACDSIHLALTAWGAVHRDAWNLPPDLTPAQLAAVLGQYAARVRTPIGPPGACGRRLMGDLRPPAHRHAATGALVADGASGALTSLVDPAPCEAPPGHQLAHQRAEQDALADTDIRWWRHPTPDEAQYPHVLCFAVNLHHFADSNNIRVANAPAQHVFHPDFDPKMPGSWLVDLSTVTPRPFLPPAFASHSLAWHTTPAVAYATLHGARPQPVQAWLRRGPTGPYLNPWYRHLRLARVAVLEQLGLTDELDTPDLLAALADLPQADAVHRALLHALHATAHGAFAALTQPPTQPDQAALATWPTPQHPTWRPDLRAAVTANARAKLHRKLCRTARDGLFPLAVAEDHILYATRTPDLTEITDVPHSGFKIGLSPGHVRPVTVRSMDWYQDRCAEDSNAAELLKGTCTSW
ncbi:telomere-associated protein Tap [Streptomyces sp. NPDC058644]|uniref:telomere-associated protein Tap n=1 Tax=unclassified Streptomyces TaxID=2593676 RepID=UPI0036522D84